MNSFTGRLIEAPEPPAHKRGPFEDWLPRSDSVVSTNLDGTVLSRYGDDFWDRTPYDTDGARSILSFKFWSNGDFTEPRKYLMEEIRWILFLIIFRKGLVPLSTGSIQNYLKPLKAIARFCDEESSRIQDVLSTDTVLINFLAQQVHFAKLIASLLKFLDNLGPAVVGYSVASKTALSKVQRQAAEWVGQVKQHPPIPTRIYSGILSILASEIDQFEHVADRLLELLATCLSNPLIGRCSANQWKKRTLSGVPSAPVLPNFGKLLEQYGLKQFWHDRDYSATVGGLSISVLELSIAISLQIQAFAGMRANEVATLRYDCLEETTRIEDGSVHYIIHGRIRKLQGGKSKPARWVTSESGRRAIRLAQRFADVIFRSNSAAEGTAGANEHPKLLFESTGLVNTSRSGKTADLDLHRFKSLADRLPEICEVDLLELEQIDPHRAWRSESKFELGRHWHLTSHQLRRSLALYAQRSGLVSLPSLKRQLHHITAEMSSYYGRGSAFAADFLIDSRDVEKHFGAQWQEAQPVSQYLSYAINVLMSDQKELFGVHSLWIKRRLETDGQVIKFDRAVTLKRFQKGELAYRETLLGGCVKVGDCDKNPLDILHVECITTHCKNMVGSMKKLARVVAAQRHLVDRLAAEDIASAEYRHESATLATLAETLATLTD